MDLKSLAAKVRANVLRMAHMSKSAHTGPALSCADVLVALYFNAMKDGDRFILSKGHGCMSYYATLAEKGIIPYELLWSYSQNGGQLAEHPSSTNPGVDVSTGSLGHGLSIAAGAALARKIKGDTLGREYVLLGDGECQEGSVWEAVMFAAHRKLNNLIAIVDCNRFQATDRCENVVSSNLVSMFNAAGWISWRVDGHDMDRLVDVFSYTRNLSRPVVIFANTLKGKGVSFMEDNLEWHYRFPNKEELELALKEIESAK